MKVHRRDCAIAVYLKIGMRRIESGFCGRNHVREIGVTSHTNLHRIRRFRFRTSVSVIGKHVEPQTALRDEQTRYSSSIVIQNGFVVGVDHVLNVDSIGRNACGNRLVALSRVWALSEVAGPLTIVRAKRRLMMKFFMCYLLEEDGCNGHIWM